MDASLRRFLARHAVTAREAVSRDVAPFRSMTPDERARELDAACRLAAEVVAASPRKEHILERRDPPHPAWAALVAKSRRRE